MLRYIGDGCTPDSLEYLCQYGVCLNGTCQFLNPGTSLVFFVTSAYKIFPDSSPLTFFDFLFFSGDKCNNTEQCPFPAGYNCSDSSICEITPKCSTDNPYGYCNSMIEQNYCLNGILARTTFKSNCNL